MTFWRWNRHWAGSLTTTTDDDENDSFLTSSTTLKLRALASSRCNYAAASPLLLDALIAAELNATLHRHRLLRVRWALHGAVGDLFDFALVRALREGAFVLGDNRSACHFHGLRVDFENSEMWAIFRSDRKSFKAKMSRCRVPRRLRRLLCLKFNGKDCKLFSV